MSSSDSLSSQPASDVQIVSERTRILGVAYHFAPEVSIGARRTERFAKYLPLHGFELSIVTSNAFGACRDDANRGVTRAFDPAGLTKRTVLGGVSDVASMRRTGRVSGAKRAVISFTRALAVPDPEIVWFPFGLRTALSLARRGGWSALFSTSSPETDHLVAAFLKWRTGLPWIADFRDGWMFEPPRAARQTVRWRSWIETHLEQLTVHLADRVVVVNDVMASDMKRRYPDSAYKVRVITNGFDPADFALVERPPVSPDFRLVHTGRLSGSRGGTSIAGLVAALEELRSEGSPLLGDLRIVMIGGLLAEESRLIEDSRVADRFDLRAPVPYEAALQAQAAASALLLVVSPDTRGVTTGKVFEYLASGRPILALAGSSPAADLVRELDAGLVVGPRNVKGIKEGLTRLHTDWKCDRLHGASPDAITRFDARHLAGELCSVFEEVLL